MLATIDPKDALRLMKIEHQAIREILDVLSEEEMLRHDTIEYGLYPEQELSFKDLLAHLICYEAYALEAIDAWKDGKKHWIGDAMLNPFESRKVHFGGIADRAQFSLQEVIAEWEATQSALETFYAEVSLEDWRATSPYPTNEATDLGGMLEVIIVSPPRPMYRHLPVHIPNTEAYIRGLRGNS